MKKTITTLLFLILCVGIYAETGYNKNQWRATKNSVHLLYSKETGEDVRWATTLAETKSMLGEETTVYYHFYDNQLLTVSYNISPAKVETLKKKYKEKVYEIQTVSMEKDYYVNMLTENGTLTNVEDLDLDLNCLLAEATLGFEIEGFSILDQINYPGQKAKVSVYDYNDDTRVCIWENFLKGMVFVIYYYHAQDY